MNFPAENPDLRRCKTCGELFQPTPRVQHIFCGRACRNRWHSSPLRVRRELAAAAAAARTETEQ